MILTYEKIKRDDPKDDAVLVQFGEENDPKYSKPIWVPRNVILILEESVNEIEVLDWFAHEKEIEVFGM